MRSAFRFSSSSESRSAAVARYLSWALILAVGATFVFKVDIVAQAPARVVASDSTRPVKPQIDAIIAAFDVREGDRVQAGQRLARMSDSTLSTKLSHRSERLVQLHLERRMVLGLIAQISPDAFAADLDVSGAGKHTADKQRWIELFSAQVGMHQAAVAEYRDRHNDAEVNRRRIEAELAAATRTLETFDAKRDALDALADRGVATRFTKIDTELEYLDLLRAKTTHEQDLLANHSRISLLARERERYLSEHTNGLNEQLKALEAEIAKTRQEVDELQSQVDKLEVFSPIDGIVQEVAIDRVNQPSGTEPLLSIVPGGGELHMLARIKNQDIGFVRPGLSATVVLEAFAPTKFGMIDAEVEQVTEDVVVRGDSVPVPLTITDNRQLASEIEKTQDIPTYVAQLKIPPEVITRLGLRPGMTGLANIRTGRRRVADFYLDPLLRAWNSALIER